MKKNKKNIIALASLLFITTNSFAQVKISGKIDVDYNYHSVDGVKQDDKLKSSTSYIDIISGEKISNDFVKNVGLKLQLPVDLTNGQTNDGELKKSFLFLDTNAGYIWLGKDNNSYVNLNKKFDFFGTDSLTSNQSILGQHKYSLTGSANELKNSIGYISPNFHGFRGYISHSKDSDKILESNNASLNYLNSNLSTFISFIEQDYTDKSQDKGIKIGVMHKIPHGNVGLIGENIKNNLESNDYKRQAYSITINQSFGVNEFDLSFTKAIDGKENNIKMDDGANQVNLGYKYAMSKRTKIYSYVSILDNDTNGNYKLNQTANIGEKHKLYGIGVSHSF